jgi:glycogen synthase
MRIAIVASSRSAAPNGLARHVDQLARGLAQRGEHVEVVAQDVLSRASSLAAYDGVNVRWFSGSRGPARLALPRPLWRQLKIAAAAAEVVDVHTDQAAFALAVARAGFRRLVLTPDAPVHQLMAWPHTRSLARVVEEADEILFRSSAQRDLLCRAFPEATRRTHELPVGVDTVELRAAAPFPLAARILLAVGPLERRLRLDRAIAALPSLDTRFRLVVVGDGPERHHLRAYADDLRVSARVWWFPRPIPEAFFYRWLRTATVTLALASEEHSGLLVMEAMAAGTPVVASDIAVHREVAIKAGVGSVLLIPPEGSPLDVADAISAAAAVQAEGSARPSLNGSITTWRDVVESTWAAYRRLIDPAAALPRVDGTPPASLDTEESRIAAGT